MTSTKKTALVIHLSCGLLRTSVREWWKYCSDETTLTPTAQICTAKHHSFVQKRNQHQGVVEILLGRVDVKPGRLNYVRWTPLILATSNGYAAVVKAPLNLDEVTPDKPDTLDRTQLSYYPLLSSAMRGR